MKAPHKTGPGGRGPHHHQPGKPPKPKPPHHKKPPKPKPAPKPKKTHAHKKPRKLSPGTDVACCAAEAVGLLLGWGWDEVLALYWRTASDPDSGASILDTLKAVRLVEYEPLVMAGSARVLSGPLAALGGTGEWHREVAVAALTADQHVERTFGHPLILGVTLPEPHAVASPPTAAGGPGASHSTRATGLSSSSKKPG